MKNNTSLIYNVALVIGDCLALTAAFTVAYILRVSLSHRALTEHVKALDYIGILISLLPFWVLLFALLGLYNVTVYNRRFQEVGRIFIGSFIGILFIISYSYMFNKQIFPARLVTLYGFIFAFLFVFLFRTLARDIQRQLFKFGKGINKVLLVGDTPVTKRLVYSLANTVDTGYKVIGIVGINNLDINVDGRIVKKYKNFKEAAAHLAKRLPHTIIQTELYSDTSINSEILTFAQEHHISYGFVPGNSELFVGNIKADLFSSVPLIAVHQTALVGWGRVVKRSVDIVLGFIFLLISSPLMIVLALTIYLSDGAPATFRHARLSRFNNPVRVFKFRTIKKEYHGLEPEAAFKKMGREDLLMTYRSQGDYLENDPRISSIGKLMRKYSLDELPQLLNVLSGDISLVGPRALVAYELEKSEQKNLITAVRSGLTGLAQISGVRDLSFTERRKLDLYYVENWSFWGDLVILAKTLWVVLRHKGTRA